MVKEEKEDLAKNISIQEEKLKENANTIKIKDSEI